MNATPVRTLPPDPRHRPEAIADTFSGATATVVSPAPTRRQASPARRLAPGMPTPSITTLSQEYGHARQTCAKALRVLEDEGLLVRIPGLGYYVKGTTGTETPA